MTHNLSKARKVPERKQSHIHIPHSSWSSTERTNPTKPIAAEDFWERLGL